MDAISKTESNEEVWAIIPARGGSKGVPRKNLALVDGVPLVSRAIRSCLTSAAITRTVVTTDDPVIAVISEREGATVVRRPADLASDHASSESAVRHTLDQLTLKEHGFLPHITLLVQCTSPFIGSTELDGVIEEIRADRCDSCFTAIPTHRFLWKRDLEGNAVGVNHDPRHRLPRQSLEAQFMESGAVYGFRTDLFLQEGNRFSGRVAVIEVREQQGIEIDAPADLDVANALAQVEWGEGAPLLRIQLPKTVRALVMDFDGVMTDDRVTVDEHGVESVVASRSDGMGIAQLRRETDMKLLVISTEVNPVVKQRCSKLDVSCITGVADKESVLRMWLQENRLDASECVYVGNDINDIPAMNAVGWSAVPVDAHPAALDTADLVLTRPGGRGAVRELCDLLIEHARAAEACTGTAGVVSESGMNT